MPIPGLTTVLEKKCGNFRPFQLRDTKVVINASDFVGSLKDKLKSPGDLEAVGFYLSIKDILSAFARCGITPYFVFPGGNEQRGKRLDSRLRKIQYELNQLEEKPETSSWSAGDSWTFSLAKHILINILRENRVPFTIVPHCVVRATAALSAQLQCPVIGSCSDYFLLVPSVLLSGCGASESALHSFLPLKYLELEPISAEDRPFLSAHVFDWEHSALTSIAPRHRILLALLMGSETMPRARLPLEQQEKLSNSEDSSIHPKERRFSIIHDWLSQFGENSNEPIERILDAQPEKQRDEFIQQLADCIPGFVYDLERHSHFLMSKLQLSEITSDNGQVMTTNLDDLHRLDTEINPKSFEKDDIVALLSGAVNSRLERMDFTVGWPPRFLKAFHEGRILTSVFQPLYGICVMFGPEAGYRSLKRSPHELALPIRLMHYRLLFGFERQSGGCDKLIGLSPHVTEYLPRGDNLIALAIPVNAINIDTSYEHTDRVLTSLLGLPLQADFSAEEWIFSLAVTLTFCRAQWSLERKLVPVDECPLTLALIACAVVNVQAEIDKGLLEHYMKLIGPLEDEFGAGSSSSYYHPGFLHDFTAIQIVYIGLWSLVNLIESMLPLTHESEHFHFLPLWRVFPSVRLVYWLAVKLETQAPQNRRHFTTRFWLPRLYRTTLQDAASAAAELRELASTFNKTLQVLASLQLSPMSPKHSVHKVELTDNSGSKTNRGPRSPSAPDPQRTRYSTEFPSKRGMPAGRSRPFSSATANCDPSEQPPRNQPMVPRAGKPAGPNRHRAARHTSPMRGYNENFNQPPPPRNPSNLQRGPRYRRGSGYSARLLNRLNSAEPNKTD